MPASRRTALPLFLSLIGAGLAGYLFYIHMGLLRGELLGGAACGASGGVMNCHAVTAGSWGMFAGIPLALWGVMGYLLVFGLALMGQLGGDWAEAALALIAAAATVFLLIDAALFAVMAFDIGLYCLFCLLTYAVNLLLLVTAVRAHGQPWPRILARAPAAVAALLPSDRRPAATIFWGFLLVAVSSAVSLHAATQFMSKGPVDIRQQLRGYIVGKQRVTIDIAGDSGHGPAGASVTLVEFSDFLCPACLRASKMNTIILAGHRRDARLVFKHYPLDNTCNPYVSRNVHPGACRVAAGAECAEAQGKFWPLHDRIFAGKEVYKPADLERDVAALGLDLTAWNACMASEQGMAAVKRDIEAGHAIGLQSTPTYVVNGIPMSGGLSPIMFGHLMEILKESGS
jgi:protein-disulfide isomerase/uncharacterized membrane protein